MNNKINKIVILGEAKSGTTGLFFKIKNSLSPETKLLFEPNGYEYQYSPGDENRSILAKILFGDPNLFNYSSFNVFDKKIFIIRDPRDRIVSEMLYYVCESSYCTNKKKFNDMLSFLEKKENEPVTVPVIDIIKKSRVLDDPNFKLDNWKKRIRKRCNWIMRFHNDHPDYFIYKYEDFVSKKFQHLENYLEFSLHGEAAVSGPLTRVIRTKTSGDWQNWFLEQDVEFFRPLLQEFMERYGYSDEWKVNQNPAVDPQYCSEYVKRTAKQRKKAEILKPLKKLAGNLFSSG